MSFRERLLHRRDAQDRALTRPRSYSLLLAVLTFGLTLVVLIAWDVTAALAIASAVGLVVGVAAWWAWRPGGPAADAMV